MSTIWQHLVVSSLALIVLIVASMVQSTIGLTSPQRLRSVSGDGDSSRRRSVSSLADLRRALAAAMFLLQVLAAIVATGQLTELFNGSSERGLSGLAIALVFIAYLTFGQALPRAVAMKDLDNLLLRLLRLGSILTTVLVPVNWLVEQVASVFVRILPGKTIEPDIAGLEEEIRPSRLDEDDDVIGADEREMIDGILSLEGMTVRDIMVPRLDIVAVDRTVAPRELMDTIVKAGHSRIPVYQESADRILGILYAKDLLPFVIGNTSRITILDLIRPAFVVPESKRLNVLFAELRRTKIHMAIVADEYGGTAGLVTIEDILEEIVGEIQDEYDADEWLFEQRSEDSLLADGRLPIEDVEDALRIRFEEDDDFGTLGGFVHKHLGRLPIQGDSFVAEGVRVEIQAVERHRVRRLLLTKLPLQSTDDERSGSGRARRSSDGEDAEAPTPGATSSPDAD